MDTTSVGEGKVIALKKRVCRVGESNRNGANLFGSQGARRFGFRRRRWRRNESSATASAPAAASGEKQYGAKEKESAKCLLSLHGHCFCPMGTNPPR